MSTKDPYTRDSDSRFTLRIPKDLLDWVREEAKRNKRSTGKQIEFILDEYFKSKNSEE